MTNVWDDEAFKKDMRKLHIWEAIGYSLTAALLVYSIMKYKTYRTDLSREAEEAKDIIRQAFADK